MRPWLLVVSLCAFSASAQSPSILIEPPGPTSVTPVVAELYVTCDPDSHTVERTGNEIFVQIAPGRYADLCDPPVPARYEVPLGVLPVGEYNLSVRVGARDYLEWKTFVVRNAAESAFVVRPAAVPSDPEGLTLRLDARDLPQLTKITVGGVTIAQPDITRAGTTYTFPAPAHAVGLADVVVETAAATYTRQGAIYYYNENAPPDPSIFERVLFPIVFHGPGAHGSQWTSEVAIDNPTSWPVRPYHDIEGEHPKGVALFVPRAEAEDLGFSLRVRDTSREAEGYGTQVPVVREKDMFRNTDLTLLNVPVTAEARTKLRIYTFDAYNGDAYVTVHRTSEPDVVVNEYYVPMRRACEPQACPDQPWFGELDLPYRGTDHFVNLYVTVGQQRVPAWAFASITNNETQQVTIVTADGNGGRP